MTYTNLPKAPAAQTDGWIDVTDTAREIGIQFPVALTRHVWARCIHAPEATGRSNETERLRTVLEMLRWAVAPFSAPDYTVSFRLCGEDGNPESPPVTLIAYARTPDAGPTPLTVRLRGEEYLAPERV